MPPITIRDFGRGRNTDKNPSQLLPGEARDSLNLRHSRVDEAQSRLPVDRVWATRPNSAAPTLCAFQFKAGSTEYRIAKQGDKLYSFALTPATALTAAAWDGVSLVVIRIVAAFFGAAAEEVALTQNATMGMGFLANGLELAPGDEVLSTDQEHVGGICPWRLYAKRRGIVVRELPLLPACADGPEGIVRLFAAAITPRTRVLMVSHITSSLGILLPVKELSALARERGVLSLIDGAQAVGQIRVDVGELGCDAYVGSPVQYVYENHKPYRRRLEALDAEHDPVLLHELKAEGMTDYYAMPLWLGSGEVNFMTVATARPGGFSDDDLDRFEALANLLAPLIETLQARRMTLGLLDHHRYGETTAITGFPIWIAFVPIVMSPANAPAA